MSVIERWQRVMDAPNTGPESLEAQLAAIQAIESESDRAEALAAIAPRLRESPILLEQALETAQQIEAERNRSQMLAAVAAQIPASEPQLLQKALHTAQQIKEEWYQVQALAAVAAQIPDSEPQLLQHALQIAENMEDEEYRSQALAVVAAQLPASEPQLLEKTLQMAENIEVEEYRVQALAAVAAQIPASERQSVLQQALDAAQQIKGGGYRSQALAVVAVQLSASEPQLLQQALDAALTIYYEIDRAKVLAAIAPHINESLPDLLQQILDATLEFQVEDYRAEALAAIAPQLSRATPVLLQKVLDAALNIEDDEDGRARVLVRLAPNLQDDLLERAKASVSEKAWQEAAADFEAEVEQEQREQESATPSQLSVNLIPQSFKNDAAQGNDLLGIEPEVEALAEVLAMRALKPPLAVGILGGWGSGKSFVMNLMRRYLTAIYQQRVSPEPAWSQKDDAQSGQDANKSSEDYPYVGHLYQIDFNSWTYAKADLWSSLMQTIFYDLNTQLTLEKHLRQTLALQVAVTEFFAHIIPKAKNSPPIDADEIATFLKRLMANRQETDALLKLLSPQFWQHCSNLHRKQKAAQPPAWTNFRWKRFKPEIDTIMGAQATEQWQSISCQTLHDIWTTAQQSAIAKLCVGDILQIVNHDLTATARDDIIQTSLGTLGLLIWQEQIASARTQGVIWQELSDLRQHDREELAAIEKSLQASETALASQSRIAELAAQKKLERQTIAVVWQPLLDLAYKLLNIDPAQVDSWKTALKKLPHSPRAYVVLACIVALLVVGHSPAWSARMAALHSIVWANLTIARVWLLEKYAAWWPASFPITAVLLQRIWGTAKQYLNEVKQAQTQLESHYQTWLQEAQENARLSELSQTVEGLRLQAEQKRRQVGILANQSSLLDFVNNRLQEDSYERRLGLMHQIGRDLEGLSQRLVAQDRAHIRDLFPRGPARVILYIDDLDRCPPDRVVDVLEAVQLLINTPLFVVVLAIDDRYIARALENAYKGVLKRRGSPSGIDYLEKIIQIPYRTRPIASSAIETYLKNHIDLEPEIVESPKAESQKTVTGSASDTGSGQDTPGTEATQPSSEMTSPEDSGEETGNKPPPRTAPIELPPPQVAKFTQEEFETLKKLCQEVDLSPRTAKRLINIYKILKILWFRLKQDRGVSTADPIKEAVLALLVLSGRYPSFMREVLAEMARFYEERQDDSPQPSLTPEAEPKPDDSTAEAAQAAQPKDKQPEQRQPAYLKDYFQSSLTHLDRIDDPYLQRECAKFLHDVDKIVPDPLTLSQIGQENFHLALSFCFVGDIGYDPEDYHLEAEGRGVEKAGGRGGEKAEGRGQRAEGEET